MAECVKSVGVYCKWNINRVTYDDEMSADLHMYQLKVDEDIGNNSMHVCRYVGM